MLSEGLTEASKYDCLQLIASGVVADLNCVCLVVHVHNFYCYHFLHFLYFLFNLIYIYT
jgi:hypothetical protein